VEWSTRFPGSSFSTPASSEAAPELRNCLQLDNDELRQRLEQAAAETNSVERALKEQRGVINDIHRRLLAVSKGLEKRLF